MDITSMGEHLIIIDNFLSVSELECIQDQLECETYNQITYGEDKVYRFNSGTIFKSINKYWLEKGPWQNNYEPFRSKLQAFLSQQNWSWTDPNGDTSVSMMVHAYMVGAELGWHRDQSCKASYSFYAHKDWHPMWGGNLLVASPKTRVPETGRFSKPAMPGTALKDSIGQNYGEKGISFDHSLEKTTVSKPGYGDFVMPLPNRLVVVKSDFYHKVERVDAAAGMNARVSLTGFIN